MFKKYKIAIIAIIVLVVFIFVGAISDYVITEENGKSADGASSSLYAQTSNDNIKKSARYPGYNYYYDIDFDTYVDELIEDLEEQDVDVLAYFNNNENKMKDTLKLMLQAELYTQYPDLRDYQYWGNDLADGEFEGCIQIYRYDSDGNSYALDYITEDDMEYYISNQSAECLKHFTIDSSGDLVVAKTTTTITYSDADYLEYSSIDSKLGAYDAASCSDEYYSSRMNSIWSTWKGSYSKLATTTTTYETVTLNYKSQISSYTMPFEYLWALLIAGDDYEFVEDLANLVLDSQINIGIYENEVITKDISLKGYDAHSLTFEQDIIHDVESGTDSIENESETDSATDYYYRQYEEIRTITLSIKVNYADIWIMTYEAEYTRDLGAETNANLDAEIVFLTDEDGEEKSWDEIEENENSTDWEVNTWREEPEEESTLSGFQDYMENGASPDNRGDPNDYLTGGALETLKTYVVETTKRHVEKTQSYEHHHSIMQADSSQTNMYIMDSDSPIIEEKTDPTLKKNDDGYPNFCTLYLDSENLRNNMSDTAEWLFEILENMDATADMVDLTKYLFYCATGTDYGVTEYDISALFPTTLSSSLSLVGNDYIVNIDLSPSEIVITDLETLKKAFSGYSGSSELIAHAQDFLDMQETYRVNAVFAAAVSITETSAGRAGHAIDGCNNWFNITGTDGLYITTYNKSTGNTYHWRVYDSASDGINAFGAFIANPNSSYYFAVGNYTVSSIGLAGYCENAESGWIPNTIAYMTQMFNAAGIDVSSTIVDSSSSTENADGDGYTQTFTYAGKTYLEYKQSRGSYKTVKYANGTIKDSGCGPTAATIVASGYGYTYNPGELVTQARSKYGVSNFSACPDSTAKMLSTAGLSYATTYSLTKTQMIQHLQTGKPIVLSVNSGCNGLFTATTHYIAILAYDSSTDCVYVSNPNPSTATGWISSDNVITCNSASDRVAFLITN